MRFRLRLAGFLLVAAGVLALRSTGEGVAPVGQFPQPPKKGAPRPTFPPNTVKQGFPAARAVVGRTRVAAAKRIPRAISGLRNTCFFLS